MGHSNQKRQSTNERALIEEPQRLKLDVEREVMGSDYGATSYTTRAEAERIGQLLDLRPGIRMLDVGAGAGWPGLFFAGTMGCHTTLIDKPSSGFEAAVVRVTRDQLKKRSMIIVGDAKLLPFANGSFDAISHCDVLC